MADELKILFPPAHGKDKKPIVIPSTFLVLGSIPVECDDKDKKKQKVKCIRVRVSHLLGDGNWGTPLEINARFINPCARPKGGKKDRILYWIATFSKAGCDNKQTHAKITASAFGKNGTAIGQPVTVEVVLNPNKGEPKPPKVSGGVGLAPLVDFPPADYVIEGDGLVLFPAMGSSELPIESVKIGTNEAAFQWDEGDPSTWWALFSDLGINPGAIDQINLVVKNADDEGDVPVEIKVGS